MERCLNPNTPVLVTVLERRGESTVSGWVQDLSGTRLRLRVPKLIPVGTPIKVETVEMLMLGEACASEPAGEAYEVSLILFQVLSSLSDLRALNRALLGEDYRKPLVHAPLRS